MWHKWGVDSLRQDIAYGSYENNGKSPAKQPELWLQEIRLYEGEAWLQEMLQFYSVLER